GTLMATTLGLTLRTALTVALTRVSDWLCASAEATLNITDHTAAQVMAAKRSCSFMNGILSAAWRPPGRTGRSMAFRPRLATGLAFRGLLFSVVSSYSLQQ